MADYPEDVSVAEAVALLHMVAPVAPKRVPLGAASGLRLAEDVVVRRPQPLEPLAARPGYAVAAAVTSGASPRRPRKLSTSAVELCAGEPLPVGTDAVLPCEDARHDDGVLFALRAIRSGAGVIAPESIAAPGTTLAAAGERITLPVAMACGMCGVTDVTVRRPIVDVVLNQPGLQRPCDQFLGLICASIRASGSEVGGVQTTAGDADRLRDALLTASGDVLAVIGGTGRGPRETTFDVLAEIGRVSFRGVRLEPGAETGFGFVGGKPVFCAPAGVAELTAANIVFTWHIARRAFGRPAREQRLLHAPLAAPLPAGRGRSLLVFARHEQGRVTPLPDAARSPQILARANVTILVPDGAPARRRGWRAPMLRMSAGM